jgi:hypothetical protein
MDYRFEERGRRMSVLMVLMGAIGMLGLGLAYGAPWFFIAAVAIAGAMALATLVWNSHSGMRLEGDTLTLFRDRWRHAIDVKTIRRVRSTSWTDGQPDIWLEFQNAPEYRLPGYCFRSAEQLKAAFRKRGIEVV